MLLAKPLTGSREERAVNRQLIKQLTDRKVSAIKAHELVEDPEVSEESILTAIEHLDFLLEVHPDKAPKQRGGWLIKAIRESYQPPSDFVSSAERQRIRAEQIAKEKQREEARQLAAKKAANQSAQHQEKIDRENRQVKAYLDDLSPADREACLDAAIAGKDIKGMASKHRRNPTPGSSGEMLFESLVRDHVLALLNSDQAA